MATRKILVVEDEASIRKILQVYLESAGYEVRCTADGSEVLALNRIFRPDLILLDLNLPGMNGIEVAVRIREESDVYIMMLTARGEEEERILGLRLGADDYVTKPFSPREVVVRVDAILRRRRSPTAPAGSHHFAHLSIDRDSHEALIGGTPLDLTATEFQVLWALAAHAGNVLTREQLLSRVWGVDYFGNERVVDVYVGQVRRKILALSDQPLIETVRGVGYKFVDDRRP